MLMRIPVTQRLGHQRWKGVMKEVWLHHSNGRGYIKINEQAHLFVIFEYTSMDETGITI